MKRAMARWVLRCLGWEIEGKRPEPPRFILIAAPHTSNWDFPMMLLFAAAFDLKISWLAKHKLFVPPVGWLMRAMGGIPVKRDRNRNMVAVMVEALQSKEELVLAIPAEGTRTRTDYWKSGFYHIARTAALPIVPSYLDYGQKRGGFGSSFLPTGDVRADMQYFREFYAPMQGKFPEQFSPVRLQEEDES